MDNWFYRYIGRTAAAEESDRSRLPGGINGPKDAYRHLLIAGELARRFGGTVARTLTDAHELEPKIIGLPANFAAAFDRIVGDHTSANEALADSFGANIDNPLSQLFADDAATEMDRHNNEVGIRIGLEARTWDDVIKMARAAISAASDGQSTNFGTPVWLPESEWRGKNTAETETPDGTTVVVPVRDNWPPDWNEGVDPRPINYEYGNESYRQGAWSPDDVRRQMSRSVKGFDDRSDWHVVRPIVSRLYEQGVEERAVRLGSRSRTARVSNGEVIHVRAHLRSGGRVKVDSHTRGRANVEGDR